MKKKNKVNREISWLHFNERVLQEAMDEKNPVIERLKFLGIFSNNRDEFFRVRVATIKRMTELKDKKDYSKRNKASQILKEILVNVEEQEKKYNETFASILTELKNKKITFVNESQLTTEQGLVVHSYFKSEVIQFLFPLMLSNIFNSDSLQDNAVYLAVVLLDSQNEKDENYALVRVPSDEVSRFILLPSNEGEYEIILLDDVIRYCMGDIFNIFGYDTYSAYTIKFTRDAELDLDEDVSKSFIEQMSDSVKRRKKGDPVRFVYDNDIPEILLKRLIKKLGITASDNLRGGGRYHNFKDFMSFPVIGDKSLVYEKFKPLLHPDLNKGQSIIKAIREKDILLHYPYQPFQYIVDLLREASIDIKVRSIKMTFYRAARDSNVMKALINASRNGKSVTVFLEIQARFDEKANIYWTRKLREEGVKIIKTLPGYKVHSKLLLIRRKEQGVNKYYSHISTGNFNESTAKVYSDDGLLTYNQDIGKEVNMLFHMFEMPYVLPRFKYLMVSPHQLRTDIFKLINNEIKSARAGKEAWMLIKINNIVDDKIVDKMYQASGAGVKIDIICRGICVLVPQIPGLSDNINVRSIVDKFLEHSRIMVFANEGDPKFYLSSADWMVRNFDRRFETACPIYDKDLQNEIMDILNIQLNDNVKARLVNAEPINRYVEKTNDEEIRSQFVTYDYLKQKI